MVYRVDVRHVSHFLKEVDLFQGLTDRHLDRIAALCEEWSFRSGEYLGLHDEPGNKLYVIRRGEITVTAGSDEANLVVRTVRERQTFPVAVLFEPPIIVTTTRAATDGDAYVIPRVRLLELCELEPMIGMRIFSAGCGILVSRYRYTLQRLAELASPEVHIDPSREGIEV